MSHIVELHLHLDGSLRPETVWELAKEQGVELPAKSAEEVKYMMEVPEDCKTLEEYLERFDLPLLVLQKADAIERVTFELVEDLAKEGVEYAELRFAPQFSIKDGLTQDEVVEAAIRGAERGMKLYPQIRVGLILCCMRGADNEELNMQTVETAKKYLGDVVCAVDIAGAEGLFPTENFAPVFAKVREYGVPMTTSSRSPNVLTPPQQPRDAAAPKGPRASSSFRHLLSPTTTFPSSLTPANTAPVKLRAQTAWVEGAGFLLARRKMRWRPGDTCLSNASCELCPRASALSIFLGA